MNKLHWLRAETHHDQTQVVVRREKTCRRYRLSKASARRLQRHLWNADWFDVVPFIEADGMMAEYHMR